MKIINKIHKAFKVATSEVCEENVYIPKQTTHGDMKRHWTSHRGSYNVELINRISEIKANK